MTVGLHVTAEIADDPECDSFPMEPVVPCLRLPEALRAARTGPASEHDNRCLHPIWRGAMHTINSLTVHDRCNRCGEQAYIRAEFGQGRELLCPHHGRCYLAALESQVAKLHDKNHRLTCTADPWSTSIQGS